MPTAAENGSAPTASTAADGSFQTGHSNGTLGDDSNVSKKRRAGILPLEVGTRVMCRWRDGKFHPVKVIERRKLSLSGVNDYEYYVHYTECKLKTFPRNFMNYFCNFDELGLGYWSLNCFSFSVIILAFRILISFRGPHRIRDFSCGSK